MNKETYLNIADLKTIRLAVADKLVEENKRTDGNFTREIALLRVQKKIDEIIHTRTENLEKPISVEVIY